MFAWQLQKNKKHLPLHLNYFMGFGMENILICSGPKLCDDVYYPRAFAKELRTQTNNLVKSYKSVICRGEETKIDSMAKIDKVRPCNKNHENLCCLPLASQT